jgi:hypothetical protein
MAEKPVIKDFINKDHIVITQAEHQQSWASLHTCAYRLYPRKQDGTLDRTVTLAYDRVEVSGQNTVTIQLLARCSGIVELWPQALHTPLMR